MKLMGIDIGDKRIGLAISDKKENMALPLKVLENDPGIGKNLEKLIIEYNIEKVIVGLPYTLKGEIGQQANKVIDFVEANLSRLNIEVIFEDERFTSKVILGETTGKNKKKYIDMASANLILQNYLDRRKNNIDSNK